MNTAKRRARPEGSSRARAVDRPGRTFDSFFPRAAVCTPARGRRVSALALCLSHSSPRARPRFVSASRRVRYKLLRTETRTKRSAFSILDARSLRIAMRDQRQKWRAWFAWVHLWPCTLNPPLYAVWGRFRGAAVISQHNLACHRVSDARKYSTSELRIWSCLAFYSSAFSRRTSSMTSGGWAPENPTGCPSPLAG